MSRAANNPIDPSDRAYLESQQYGDKEKASRRKALAKPGAVAAKFEDAKVVEGEVAGYDSKLMDELSDVIGQKAQHFMDDRLAALFYGTTRTTVDTTAQRDQKLLEGK